MHKPFFAVVASQQSRVSPSSYLSGWSRHYQSRSLVLPFVFFIAAKKPGLIGVVKSVFGSKHIHSLSPSFLPSHSLFSFPGLVFTSWKTRTAGRCVERARKKKKKPRTDSAPLLWMDVDHTWSQLAKLRLSLSLSSSGFTSKYRCCCFPLL